MSIPKMTTALLGLLVPGILAITPYANSQSTVTAEPQLIGTTTSDGMLMYSVNYCTIVENTQCQVAVSTANVVPAESSTDPAATEAAPTDAVEPSAIASESAEAPATGETVLPGESEPTTFVSEVAPGAPQSSEAGIPVTAGQPTLTVISTTDEAGNPTFVTSTALSAAGSAATTSGTAFESASTTTGEHSNSTSTGKHDGHSATTSPSAPNPTGAGATLQALPGVILGAAVMAALFLI